MEQGNLDESMDVVTGNLDTKFPVTCGTIQEGEEATLGNVSSIDKATLLKIKRKEQTKLKKKNKALQRNVAHLTASELQQSVASLATNIGGMVNSSMVNDPLARRSGAPLQDVGQAFAIPACDTSVVASSPTIAMNLAEIGKPPMEIPLCIMDSSNLNAKLTIAELDHINNQLEKSIYKDLNVASKIKIATTYLSNASHVWIICHSIYTSSWVIKRINEAPAFNGRMFTAHTLPDLEVLNQVSVFVPKECTMVKDFENLMRCLLLQNPTLSKGRAVMTKEWELCKELNLTSSNAGSVDRDNTIETEAILGGDGDSMQVVDAVICEHVEVGGDTEVADDAEVGEDADDATADNDDCNVSSAVASVNLQDAPDGSDQCNRTTISTTSRNRSFCFYADDVWLASLKQLNYRPYLGARRVVTAVGDRFVHSVRASSSSASARNTSTKFGNDRRRRWRGKMTGRVHASMSPHQ